jgi:hypothetical protein
MKNYVFAAHEPIENLRNVNDQMFFAHRYKNKLVELELNRRKAFEGTLRRLCPDYDAAAAKIAEAEAKVAAVTSEIKRASAKARKRVEATPEQTVRKNEAYEALRKAYNAAKKAYGEAKKLLTAAQKPLWEEAAAYADKTYPKPATPEALTEAEKTGAWTEARYDKRVKAKYLELAVAAGVDAGGQSYDVDVKKARENSQCYWGTYGAVEDCLRGVAEGPPPRFKSWDGRGTLCISPKNGILVSEAMACDGVQLRLELQNEAELAMKGSSHGSRAIGRVWMRIGSEPNTGNRVPTWAVIPVVFCRYLDPKAKIVKAYIHKRRVGTKVKWSFRMVLELPYVEPTLPDGEDSQLVAVHPGWRMVDEIGGSSLRVCTAVSSDPANNQALFLDQSYLDKVDKLAEIDSLRSLDRNGIQEELTSWCARQPTLPAWFLKYTETMAQWLSANRFAQLAWLWRKYRTFWEIWTPTQLSEASAKSEAAHWADVLHISPAMALSWLTDIPFVNDAEMFQRFAGYRNKNRNLLTCSWLVRDSIRYDHWANLMEHLTFARRDKYRKFARNLARRYQYVALANINWAELARKSREGTGQQFSNRQRQCGRLASPGELWLYVKEAFAGRTIIVPAENITAACHQCGDLQEFDRMNLRHTCTKCFAEYDQDINGCRNQLAAAHEIARNSKGYAKAAALPPPSKLKPKYDAEGNEIPPKQKTLTRGRRKKAVS